jgi:hypothetical protein
MKPDMPRANPHPPSAADAARLVAAALDDLGWARDQSYTRALRLDAAEVVVEEQSLVKIRASSSLHR